MAELQTIKRRLRSVLNTRQITKAMQLVAASKLRRAAAAAVAPAEYVAAVRELIARSSSTAEASRHPFYQAATGQRTLAIVISADRGLAGAYNNNLFRELGRLQDNTKGNVAVIAVGRRGALHLSHASDLDEVAAYEMDTRDADSELARPILTEAAEQFLNGYVDVIKLISTRYYSSSRQKVETRQLLPLPVPQMNPGGQPKIEPDGETLLATATSRLLEAEVFQAIVEARAAEQAARMVAMLNASDNASDLIDDLTLARNNARQSAITQELAEISGGAEAVSGN